MFAARRGEGIWIWRRFGRIENLLAEGFGWWVVGCVESFVEVGRDGVRKFGRQRDSPDELRGSLDLVWVVD